jgi:hypothetical protein
MSVIRKPKSIYKQKNNILQIDHRLKTYDYDFKMDGLSYYIFDIEFNCIYATDLDLPVKRSYTNLFPEDIHDFFDTLFRNTLVKSQMVHVQLNGTHLLYNTNPFIDHMNNIIGIMLYEIPFTQVQSLQIEKNYEFLHLQIHYIVNFNGDIFAMEKINWDKFLRSHALDLEEKDRDDFIEKWKSDNILHKNVFDYMEGNRIKYIYKRLYKHMVNVESSPIRFCMFCTSPNFERKLLTTLSRFVDSQVYILTTYERFEEIESAQICEYLAFPHISSASNKDINKINVYELCSFCKRIEVPTSEKEIDPFAKHVVYYNRNIPPVYENEINLPFFGKRGSMGQQSFKILTTNKNKKGNKIFSVWMTMEEWKNSEDRILAIKSKIYIKYTVCDLCLDEWEHFFNNFNITELTQEEKDSSHSTDVSNSSKHSEPLETLMSQQTSPKTF